MRNIALLALAVSVLPRLSLAAESKEWMDYARPDLGVQVSFPGQPREEMTTYTSEYGAPLPARVFRAEDGKSRFSLTVVDYRPAQSLLTEKAKHCARGLERCVGTPGAGAGYWRLDKRGAMIYAASQIIKRDGKVTYFWQDEPMMMDALRLQLTNPDGSRTFVGIMMRNDTLYMTEGTGPADDITPDAFAQGLTLIESDGKPIFYGDFYNNAYPAPPKPTTFTLADPDVIYRQIHPEAGAK